MQYGHLMMQIYLPFGPILRGRWKLVQWKDKLEGQYVCVLKQYVLRLSARVVSANFPLHVVLSS